MRLGGRRWRRPGWLQLLTSRDFGAISLINGIMFMTANGSRSVLVPLHGHQAFGLTTTVMGAPPPPARPSLACVPVLLWPFNQAARSVVPIEHAFFDPSSRLVVTWRTAGCARLAQGRPLP